MHPPEGGLPGLPPSGTKIPIDRLASGRGLGSIIEDGHFEISEEELEEASNVTAYGDAPDEAWGEFTADLMRYSCAFFAQEILTGPPEPPYNGRFLISEHHEEWDQLISEYDRICCLAPRDHGKCQVGSALIADSSGRRVRIDEWEGGNLWAYDPKTHQFVETPAPASRPNGVRRVLRVTTRTGRRVEVTENHPLRLWDRWERADQLQVGQRIGVPYRTPSKTSTEVEDAWLVGLLVGDGGLTGSNVVASVADSRVLDALRMTCEVRHAGNYDYRLLGLQPRMRELGLMEETSHTKRVPEAIFQSSDASVAEFLSGYLDADAHVNPYGGGSVEFYSVSEDLLRDVQHLLTRLGVLAVLSLKQGIYRGERHTSWRLTIRGKDLLTLGEALTPRGVRAQELQRLVRAQAAKSETSGDCVDRFPAEVWSLLRHNEDWFRKRGFPRPSKQYAPTREKVLRVARAEGNEELVRLAEAPVLWDEIVSIDDLGQCETWSIHVPTYVNYLANDVINHNTFFYDFAYPIWKAYYMPRGKGFIFSATAPQAERILADIKQELETNPKLRWLVPEKPEKWTNKEIRLSNGHTIYARGFGTKVRGAHPNWIVVDDGLNDETAYSEVVRQKQNDYFFTAITNMITPGGQIIVVGTPFHQSDLYAQLEKNEEYEFRRYQAWDAKNDRALWPDRYSKKLLESRKREIGNVRFNREFQCIPIADEMSLFPSYLFVGSPVEQPSVKLGMPIEWWRETIGIKTVMMGGDFAISAEMGADFSVFWVMGLDKFNNRWIMDIFREKGLAYQKQLSTLNRMGRLYEPGLIFLEANQMQRIFGDELIRTTDLPIKLFTTTAEKHMLDKGVPSIRVLLENKKYRIPRGDKRSVELTDIWIAEMNALTFLKGKVESMADHDDTVMANWICDQACRMGAFDYSFGEEDDVLTPEQLNAELMGIDEDAQSGDDGIAPATGNLIDPELAF